MPHTIRTLMASRSSFAPGMAPSPHPHTTQPRRRTSFTLRLAVPALLGLFALSGCGDEEKEKPDYSLPVGDGRTGGGAGGGGGFGGGSSADPEIPDEIPDALPADTLVFLQDVGAETSIAYLSGTKAVELHKANEIKSGNFDLHPSRDRLVYLEDKDLILSNLAGDEQTMIFSLEDQSFEGLSSPRFSPDGKSVLFIGIQETSGGEAISTDLYQVPATEAASPQKINASKATCTVLRDPIPFGSARAVLIRNRCTNPNDAGIFDLRFGTGNADSIVTLTTQAPNTQLGHLAADRSQSKIFFVSTGGFDLNNDLSPEPDTIQTAVYELTLSNAQTREIPLTLNNTERVVGMAVRTNGTLVADLKGKMEGFWQLDFGNQDANALYTHPNARDPLVR